MKMKTLTKERPLEKAVKQSSKLEGLSWRRAKNNSWVIQKLKRYGRAFSL